MIIRRRGMLIGSWLAMTLALMAAGAPAQEAAQNPRLKVGDQWNHGEDPWDPHPANFKFHPERVGIIHIELLDNFQIKATRFHYDSLGADGDKSWGLNQATAIKVIDWLNGNGDLPEVDGICRFDGLMDLKFGQPHHVVVYIKNKNIKYPPRPLWFGDSLQGTVKNDVSQETRMGSADKNRSFFNVSVLTPAGENRIKGDVSKQFIYSQNHFHKHKLLTGYDPISEGELKVYSMKIALLSQSMVGGVAEKSEIPIIIDPDTGNMGGGHPFICRSR